MTQDCGQWRKTARPQTCSTLCGCCVRHLFLSLCLQSVYNIYCLSLSLSFCVFLQWEPRTTSLSLSLRLSRNLCPAEREKTSLSLASSSDQTSKFWGRIREREKLQSSSPSLSPVSLSSADSSLCPPLTLSLRPLSLSLLTLSLSPPGPSLSFPSQIWGSGRRKPCGLLRLWVIWGREKGRLPRRYRFWRYWVRSRSLSVSKRRLSRSLCLGRTERD